jgi:hypothetical protein
MRRFLYDVLLFIFTILTYWQASAPATFITGVTGVIEKVRDKSVSKRAYIAIFVVAYLFFGFFLAWRDQVVAVREASKTIGQLETKIKDLENASPGVNEPFMQVAEVYFPPGFQFRVGKPIGVNIVIRNTGLTPARNVTLFAHFDVLTLEQKHATGVDELFKKVYAHRDEYVGQGEGRSQGTVVGARGSELPFFSVFLESPISNSELSDLKKGIRVLCLGVRIEYQTNRWYEYCAFYSLLDHHWHTCAFHNDSH